MESRVRKRSSKACQRCQRYKIKCSGSQPCETCKKRNLTCVIDGRAQKVLVSQGFIDDLQRKVALLEQCNDLTSPRPISDNLDDGDRQPPGTSETVERSLSPELANPLSTGPSTFISTSFGRSFYLGTSSNWSFARKVVNMVHEQVHASPLPTETRHFDETAYVLDWNGLRTVASLDLPITPALDFSIYLLNAVKFHAGQLFHLFHEPSFIDGLHAYYANPTEQRTVRPLWYVQFLLLLAFGKAYVSQRRPDHPSLPGYEFFAPALQLLPDSIYLYRYPLQATEILCCVALYLHSLDYRSPAYGFIGQAVRLSLASGMHTDMPTDHLGEEALQRRRQIWWTVYILDRQITSLQGLPQAIDDAQIHHELPHFQGCPEKTTALRIQIRMCQIIADIDKTVYGINGRLNQGFLSSTKTALENTADLDATLQDSYPLDLDEDGISGVSRLSASLHLLYHQCIVLATRPLVFCFLKMRHQSVDSNTKPLSSSVIACKLLKACIESAKQMLNILVVVQKQSMLDSFLPFDLESTFMSALVVLTAPSIDPCLLEDSQPWLDKAYEVLEEMVYRGNTVARFRRAELDQLRELLKQRSLETFADDTGSSMPPVLSLGDGDDLEATDIMTLAGLIETGDVDWIAHMLTENSIW